nr:L-histidine N(alpha)-methyltransferase [Chelatococcus reniformis]
MVQGLIRKPKQISPKYFYDEAGSALFERITALKEYYPTRTEIGILEARADGIAACVPDGAVLVEFGSGSSTKVRLLLDRLPTLHAYVPVDISDEFLRSSAEALQADYPALRIAPVAADFTQPFTLPAAIAGRPLVGFFPGSTIGNFEPADAAVFLAHAGSILGPGASMIVGVDLVKDAAILNAAYDDGQGVTAAFNLNLLARANRELAADFELAAFAHKAFFNPEASRVEMHLASRRAQEVQVAGVRLRFGHDETIHTENSYKYTPDGFRALAAQAGWASRAVWTDAEQLFSVHMLTRG